MTNIGLPARVILAAAGAILIWGSPGEIGSRSGGSSSWGDERSYAALQLRALGALKLGVGLALCGASVLGVTGEEAQGAAHRLAEHAAAKTEPKPQPPAAPVRPAVVMPPQLHPRHRSV